jgi:hypothetical protein
MYEEQEHTLLFLEDSRVQVIYWDVKNSPAQPLMMLSDICLLCL